MILQVHDELVFDVPEDEVDILRACVREAMEGAVELAVPLVADIGVGRHWAEAH
jgi:DNA polymerase-1